MNYEKAFPSKYIKAADLDDGPQQATITGVVQQDLFDDVKLVAKLDNMKPLVLNRGNANTIATLAGSKDTEKWVGLRIELYATETSFKGEQVPCVRVRGPRLTRKSHPLPPEHEADAPLQEEEDASL